MSDIDSRLTTIYTKHYNNDDNNSHNTEIYSLFQSILNSYNNKLWYQLTLQLKQLIKLDPQLSLDLYNDFILSFLLDKLNPLDIVNFLLFSQDNNYEHNLSDLRFLLNTFDKKLNELKNKNEPRRNYINYLYSNLLIHLEISKNQLYLNNIVVGKDYLNQFESLYLNNNNSSIFYPRSNSNSNSNSNLNSSLKEELPIFIINKFYEVNSIYYDLKGDYNSFYTTSLLYLSTLDKNNNNVIGKESEYANLNSDLQLKLCISAIKGDKIYNFGELLQHPILKDCLQTDSTAPNSPVNPKLKYVVDILISLSQGDFNRFNELLNQAAEPSSPYRDLNLFNITGEDNQTDTSTLLFLRQKICIMTLIELIFVENLRILSFEQIAKATHLTDNITDVEHLIMKAISLGLIKGSIDQVNQLVTITWVQPRIINLNQIKKMNEKLIQWNSNVQQLANRMDQYGSSIWV
ncbi:proteasome regulatory particle lid subunit RPN9 PWA37_001760 [Arxiozyma heterogenica]|uniref:proteasome regulatory particle lid subunit RPN9 n=1 Tax=Arxiozyma heterogenica TaxID=278026 RepID=UPI002EEE7B5B